MGELTINIKPSQDFAWLIEAANDVMTASESDFSSMKEKKWYTRLWETITFSKDNQIRTAKGVSNLAKLQEIITRTLVILSKDNAEISAVVRKNSEQITKLSIVDGLLLKKINRIAYGGNGVIEFSDISKEKKALIANLLVLSDRTVEKNEHSKRYISAILIKANLSAVDLAWNISAVENLNNQEQELLYQMIMINRHLMHIDFDFESDVIDNISISPKRAREIISAIEETAQFTSPDFFISFYEGDDYPLKQTSEDEIVFCSDDGHTSEDNTNQIRNAEQEENASATIFSLYEGHWNNPMVGSFNEYAIETANYYIMYLNPCVDESSYKVEGPGWLRVAHTNTVKTLVDTSGLYAISKFTGKPSLLCKYEAVPKWNMMFDSVWCDDTAIVQLRNKNDCKNTEVYVIDVAKKELRKIYSGDAELVGCDQNYVVLTARDKVIVFDRHTYKSTNLQLRNVTTGRSFTSNLRCSSMENGKLYVASGYMGTEITCYDIQQGIIDWSVKIKETNKGPVSLSIFNSKLYLLVETKDSSYSEYRKLHTIYKFDISKRGEYTPVEKDIVIYQPLLRKEYIKQYSDGFAFIRDNAPQMVLGEHILAFYSFEKEKDVALAKNCGKSNFVKDGFFSKSRLQDDISRFDRIGNIFFYESGSNRAVSMVAISRPMRTVIL